MAPVLHNAPYRISPDAFGPGDCFVGSRNGCRAFRESGKACYEINLHAKLNDIEKKRRIGELIGFIKSHPGRTFYVSAIGCGRGHVDREIVGHLTKPLVWLCNVRLPAFFLTDLLKDGGYKESLDKERQAALKAWHREYSAGEEKEKRPAFYNAAQGYPKEVRDDILQRISDYNLKKGLFRDDSDFKSFMNNLRDTLEIITKLPLPDCLEGNTDRYGEINFGGRINLFREGKNKLPNSKPEVRHNLRSDLRDWVTRDNNKLIFVRLESLRVLTNSWSHPGKRVNYDTLAKEVVNEFRSFVTNFPKFLAEVRKVPSA